MQIKFDKTCFNPAYIPFHNDDARVRILYGGRDSAKSHEIALEMLIDFMRLEYSKIILYRKIFRDIRGSQFAQILDLIGQFKFTHMFEVNQNRLEIKYIHRPDSLIMARGLDVADKTKSLNDPTHAWYEEANQISEDDYITASLGLRSSRVEKTKEIMSFNPDKECWIENFFFPERETYERPDGKFMYVPSTRKDVSIYHMGYWNNSFISEERIEKLNYLKERSPDKFRVNALGLWGRGIDGQIFESYNIIESMPSNADTYFGVDYGYNNPSAVVEIGRIDNDLYWDELLYQKGLTQSDLAENIVQLRHRIGKTPVVVDSANPSLIEELERAGFNVFKAEKTGANSVNDGLNWMKGFNQNITRTSTNIIQNFDNYVYEKDKYGQPVDKPLKYDDHAIDAGRYAAWKFGFLEGRWLTGGSPILAYSPPSRIRTNARGGLRKSKINR